MERTRLEMHRHHRTYSYFQAPLAFGAKKIKTVVRESKKEGAVENTTEPERRG